MFKCFTMFIEAGKTPRIIPGIAIKDKGPAKEGDIISQCFGDKFELSADYEFSLQQHKDQNGFPVFHEVGGLFRQDDGQKNELVKESRRRSCEGAYVLIDAKGVAGKLAISQHSQQGHRCYVLDPDQSLSCMQDGQVEKVAPQANRIKVLLAHTIDEETGQPVTELPRAISRLFSLSLKDDRSVMFVKLKNVDGGDFFSPNEDKSGVVQEDVGKSLAVQFYANGKPITACYWDGEKNLFLPGRPPVKKVLKPHRSQFAQNGSAPSAAQAATAAK